MGQSLPTALLILTDCTCKEILCLNVFKSVFPNGLSWAIVVSSGITCIYGEREREREREREIHFKIFNFILITVMYELKDYIYLTNNIVEKCNKNEYSLCKVICLMNASSEVHALISKSQKIMN